jgi:hypothetical protein
MTSDDRTPADLLLLLERRRRMTSASGIAGPLIETGMSSEPVLLESDAIVDGFIADPVPLPGAALHLYRPLSTVTLAQMPWTGAIDHGTLMLAIGCAPIVGPRFVVTAGWFANLALAGAAVAAGESALHVSLSTGDVELIESAASLYAGTAASELVLATLLPSAIVGADASTIDAAAAVLTAYRRTSLVVAWLEAIGGGAGADATSRRDEAAAAAMSMLRALLGEA